MSKKISRLDFAGGGVCRTGFLGRGSQRALDLGDLPVSDRIEDELAQLLDLARLDREELRTAVRGQSFPVQTALPLNADQRVHGSESLAGGEVEDCHAFLHVGVQKAVEPFQILAGAQGDTEEIQLHRLDVKIAYAVVITRVESGQVAFICCAIHILITRCTVDAAASELKTDARLPSVDEEVNPEVACARRPAATTKAAMVRSQPLAGAGRQGGCHAR
jgi:hypothetical protein